DRLARGRQRARCALGVVERALVRRAREASGPELAAERKPGGLHRIAPRLAAARPEQPGAAENAEQRAEGRGEVGPVAAAEGAGRSAASGRAGARGCSRAPTGSTDG